MPGGVLSNLVLRSPALILFSSEMLVPAIPVDHRSVGLPAQTVVQGHSLVYLPGVGGKGLDVLVPLILGRRWTPH